MPNTDFREKPPPKRNMSRTGLRQLTQYRNMTDAEFDEMYDAKINNREKDAYMQAKIDKLAEEFKQEYDLSDMLPNDRAVLKSLIQAIVDLEDYTTLTNSMKKDGIGESNIFIIEKINAISNALRKDISQMQADLKITRKVRQSDKEQSALTYLEDLKVKAKKFYRAKNVFVFCEKCGLLLATVWIANQASTQNKIRVHCSHVLDDGSVCGFDKEYSIKNLIENGGSNKPDLLPESVK